MAEITGTVRTMHDKGMHAVGRARIIVYFYSTLLSSSVSFTYRRFLSLSLIMTFLSVSPSPSRPLLLAALCLFSLVGAQFNEPPGQRRGQTYRVLEFENGSVNQRFEGSLRYYCTFRGKWTKERHPNDFPRSPSYSAPLIISHSNGYRMWTGSETATLGVESIAEVSKVLYCLCVCVCVFVRFRGCMCACVHVCVEYYGKWGFLACFLAC
jgi:hypothetical protein